MRVCVLHICMCVFTCWHAYVPVYMELCTDSCAHMHSHTSADACARGAHTLTQPQSQPRTHNEPTRGFGYYFSNLPVSLCAHCRGQGTGENLVEVPLSVAGALRASSKSHGDLSSLEWCYKPSRERQAVPGW